MTYPLLTEYIDSILMAEENFATLTDLRPVLDDMGKPVMSSGNFSVVFKMKNIKNDKLYAIKCFTKEQEGREDAYRLISDEMMTCNRNSYMISLSYLHNELYVESRVSPYTEFPIVKMEWVDGLTLDMYIKKHKNDDVILSQLVYNFSQLAFWLANQPFAHGDLKPDNIIVKENTDIVLVDYDGMFVNGMQGQYAREIGSPDFQHPERVMTVYTERIDDFSLISILLSLKVASLDYEFYEKYSSSDRLLFSKSDYINPSDSDVLKELPTLFSDKEFCRLFGIFMLVLSTNDLSCIDSKKILCLESKQNVNDWLHYYHGVELVKDKDYAHALKVFESIQNDDSKFKLNALGYCYANGYGVVQDSAKAAIMFLKSAKQGFWPAMTNIGHCYYHGIGIDESKEQSNFWINKCNHLGVGPGQWFIDSVCSFYGAVDSGLMTENDVKEIEAEEWEKYKNITMRKFFLGIKGL